MYSNQYLKNYIDSVNKDRAAYPEDNTLQFKNVANIKVDSYSITPQKNKIGERNIVRNRKIPFNKNGEKLEYKCEQKN